MEYNTVIMKRWTTEELEILIKNYPSRGAKGCSILLKGRTAEAIAKQARSRGIKHSTTWTIEQVNILKEFYPIYGSVYCSELINKDPKNISIKAHRLGIKHLNQYGRWSHKDYEYALMEAEAEAYPLEEYRGYATHILHGCLEGHTWETTPNIILSAKAGCPKCSNSSFKLDIPAILYYIKITTKERLVYYKIGITNRTVEERFSSSRIVHNICILKETKFSTGKEAKESEQEILELFKNSRKHIKGLLVEGGNTELFEEDILGLDTEKAQ